MGNWWPAVGLMTLAAGTSFGCAHRGPSPPPAAETKADDEDTEIIIDDALIKAEPTEVIAAWMVYAADKRVLWNARTPKLPGRSPDDFTLELMTRELLASSWEEKRAKGTSPNAELDLMVALKKEALMAPYLLTYWALPGWTVPASDLVKMDLPRFRDWSAQHLPSKHAPERHILFRPRDGVALPTIPGGSLPDVAAFDPNLVPCASSREVIQHALRQWDSEQSGIQGVPIAARDRAALVQNAEHVRATAPYSERGVTWVSAKVHTLHYVAGFCALDARQYPEAEMLLGRAVSLLPTDSRSRSELAQVYLGTHRLDAAEKVLHGALDLAVNRCEKARVMRAQGFVQVERGQLLEAYQTYGQSLGLDSNSVVARRELAFISVQLRRRGLTEPAKKLDAAPPPTAVETTVTSCPP